MEQARGGARPAAPRRSTRSVPPRCQDCRDPSDHSRSDIRGTPPSRPPLADRDPVPAELVGGLGVRPAVRAGRHDPRPQRQRLRRRMPSRPAHQRLSIFIGQLDRDRRSTGTSHRRVLLSRLLPLRNQLRTTTSRFREKSSTDQPDRTLGVRQPRQQAAPRPAAADGLGVQSRPVEHRQTDDAVARGAAIAECRDRRRDSDPLR